MLKKMNAVQALVRIVCKLLMILAIGEAYLISFKVSAQELTLVHAIGVAQNQDVWIMSNKRMQESIEYESKTVSILPDPKISIAASNFPTDTFDFNQEPMTQLNVGITQMFPRGESRSINSRLKQQLADQYPYLRTDRKARIALIVTQFWLDAFKSQQTIGLINADRSLFEQMVDFTEVSYSTASGMARQQDVVRAQLELTQLDDRLTKLTQQLELAKQSLSEWLPADMIQQSLSKNLPQLEILNPDIVAQQRATDSQLSHLILKHPALLAFDQKIKSSETNIDLARQKYKPEWGLTAKYGYRGHDIGGAERADFLSLGIVFDMPMFNRVRQDSQVKAAASKAAATRLDKQLVYRKMKALLKTSLSQLKSLNRRSELYNNKLLPQMHEQAEASLTAYNNDDGDFAEAIRARIAQLNAKIEALNIAVAQQKEIAQLNYLLIVDNTSSDQVNALQESTYE